MININKNFCILSIIILILLVSASIYIYREKYSYAWFMKPINSNLDYISNSITRFNLLNQDKLSINDSKKQKPNYDVQIDSVNNNNNSEIVDIMALKYIPVVSTINKIIIKFLQDIDYSEEIDFLLKVDIFPDEINIILTKLYNYNKNYLISMLVSKPSTLQKNKLGKLIDYFFQIEEFNYNLKQKEQDYQEIIENLNVLQDYFYAKQLLKELVND